MHGGGQTMSDAARQRSIRGRCATRYPGKAGLLGRDRL